MRLGQSTEFYVITTQRCCHGHFSTKWSFRARSGSAGIFQFGAVASMSHVFELEDGHPSSGFLVMLQSSTHLTALMDRGTAECQCLPDPVSADPPTGHAPPRCFPLRWS
jgi:hypothetical protein